MKHKKEGGRYSRWERLTPGAGMSWDSPESSFGEKDVRVLVHKLNYVRQKYVIVAKTAHIFSDFSKTDINRTRKAV